jgi:hypothetical protein
VSDDAPAGTAAAYGEQVSWQPATPRLRPLRLLSDWRRKLHGAPAAAERADEIGREKYAER